MSTKAVSVLVKCPLCGESLMDNEHLVNDKPSIKLNIRLDNARGIIRLSSIYGSYNHWSNIKIANDYIAEFSCPHCNQILISEEKCDKCSAPMVPFILDIGGRVVICSRSGCKKHYVAFENPDDAISRFYDEYGF